MEAVSHEEWEEKRTVDVDKAGRKSEYVLGVAEKK